MQIVNGYRTKSGSMKRMTMIATKLGEKIREVWRKQYLSLLSDEVAYTADAIVLGTEQYDNNLSILKIAEDKIANAVRIAGMVGNETSYNLVVVVEFMYMPDGYVYINVVSPNWYIADGIFDDIPEIEKYDVSATEAEQATGHIETWNKIAREYSNGKLSFRQNYIPELPLVNVAKDDLTFKKPVERALFHAMSRERNNVLAALCGGQQIPPQLLMKRLDEVEIEMQAPLHQQHVQNFINQLSGILPELTYEMITGPLGKINEPERHDIVTQLEEQALASCDAEEEAPAEETATEAAALDNVEPESNNNLNE